MAQQGVRFQLRYVSIFWTLVLVVPMGYSHQSTPVTESTGITEITKD